MPPSAAAPPKKKPFTVAQAREGAQLAARTLGLVFRASPGATFALGTLTVGIALLPLAIAYAGKEIVDAVVSHDAAATRMWVLIELAIVAAQVLVQRGLGLLRELLGERLSLDINVAILEKALTLELRHFEDGRFYDSLTRARRDASYRPVAMVTEGFQLIQNALTLAGYLTLIVSYSGLAALALLGAAIPAAVSEMWFSRSAFRMKNWRSPESRQVNYLEYILANDAHVKEVKLFGLGRLLLDRYEDLGEKFLREDRRLALRRSVFAIVLSLLGTGAFYACYAGVALAAATKTITLGNMTLYLIAFRQGQQAFQSVLAAIGGIYENTLSMSNLFEYLSIPTDEPARPASPAPVHPGDGIRFEGVGFRYPVATPKDGAPPPEKTDDRWALRNVSFHIPAGQSVALVGQNGAGKTTLIKLLTRLYEPTEGRVVLDGKDLRDWDKETLRRRVAVIFQDFNEYQFDVKDNVGLGSLEHLSEVARIERAAARGGADEVVASLPEGLATRLGKWAHDGVELSGGQWQKIALARAFMREEADILVLDEPTAALDAEAEHAIFERFRKLAEGRTTFLISHRFSTTRMADRILVLEGGHVAEDGSHEALLARDGRYAKLFKLQAQGYLN
jgi:ATP-binding cassette subfamily B protein